MDKKADVVPYIWFDWDVAVELASRILAAPPKSRLIIRPSQAVINEHTSVTLEIALPDALAARAGPLNQSHICPPIC